MFFFDVDLPPTYQVMKMYIFVHFVRFCTNFLTFQYSIYYLHIIIYRLCFVHFHTFFVRFRTKNILDPDLLQPTNTSNASFFSFLCDGVAKSDKKVTKCAISIFFPSQNYEKSDKKLRKSDKK